MNQELYALSDMAKLLAVKPYRILYLLSVDPSLEPKLRLAGKRLWTLAEISPISERLKLQTALQWKEGLEGGSDA